MLDLVSAGLSQYQIHDLVIFQVLCHVPGHLVTARALVRGFGSRSDGDPHAVYHQSLVKSNVFSTDSTHRSSAWPCYSINPITSTIYTFVTAFVLFHVIFCLVCHPCLVLQRRCSKSIAMDGNVGITCEMVDATFYMLPLLGRGRVERVRGRSLSCGIKR